MFDEIIPALAGHIIVIDPSKPVMAAGDDQHIKVLVVLDEGISQTESGGGIDVLIQFPMDPHLQRSVISFPKQYRWAEVPQSLVSIIPGDHITGNTLNLFQKGNFLFYIGIGRIQL